MSNLIIPMQKDGVILGARLEDGITFAQWIASLGAEIRDMESRPWIIGDAYNSALSLEWGAKAKKATEVGGMIGASSQSVRKWGWVCSRIEFVRRRTISFSHHEDVAEMIPKDQDEWLALAQGEGWSRADLREAIFNASDVAVDLRSKPERSFLAWAVEGVRMLNHMDVSHMDTQRRAFLKRELDPLVRIWEKL